MRSLALLVPLLLACGCASIAVHDGAWSETGQAGSARVLPTPIFGGFVTDFRVVGECLSAPARAAHSDTAEWWEVFFFPLPLVDAPLSLVWDAFCLPLDIAHWPKEADGQ